MDDQALEPWRSGRRPRGECSSSAATDYDVFLNHRGPDVKAGFIAHLDEALRAAGLNPFLDKTSLVKGNPAFSSMEEALELAKVHVTVVSKGYAESKYCLNELVAIVRSGKPVIPVFYDVEPGHLRWVENGPFAAAFEKHKFKKSPEQVQQWRDALQELAAITGFRLSDFSGDEADLKRTVVDGVLSLIPSIEALRVEPHWVGMEEQVNTCINKLEKMSGGTSLLGLVGMGGIGKTSLAKEVYNHFVGQRKFQAMSFLEIDRNILSSMEVGPRLLDRLQKQLLWDLLQVGDNKRRSYKYWFNRLSSRGRVLIVLDDVYDKAQFDELMLDTGLLARGSCIVITSRDRHLLKVIAGGLDFYLHEVRPLKEEDSQKVFNLHAFGNEEAPEKFQALASGVSQACGGLPLALKVVGCSLFDKRCDEDLECIWPEAVDALKGDLAVTTILKWSYDCLPKSEKLMFVDIACVFYGWKKEEALEIWQSCKKCSSCCGFGTPSTSLRKLIDKSLVLLQYFEGENILVMHGLLRDLGQSIGVSDGSHLWEGRAANATQYKNEGSNKVRAVNLANSQKHRIELEGFAKMPNLHYLVLDGCDASGGFGHISKELRWLRWRHMPLPHIPALLDLSNLVSLDLSESANLANIWVESDPTMEALPNLLSLNMSGCNSITTLPDSIGRLSRLRSLDLSGCQYLQKLPSFIGQLTALKKLLLHVCRNLEALPDTITALSGLQMLGVGNCSSMFKLPTTMGLMTGLATLLVDLATEWQAVGIGELNALERLSVTRCTDEVVSVLDRSGTLGNLDHLSRLFFLRCWFMTKLPETVGLLTKLEELELWDCRNVQELPKSIGQLKVLRRLYVRRCSSLETLPDSLGALTSLQELWIVQCPSMNKLPTSLGQLSRLCRLRIEGCGELQPLPDSLRHLDALQCLEIMDCGSLETLGLLRILQGLRIWGCTSITELPGSCVMVLDSDFCDPALFENWEDLMWVHQDLKEVRVVEANDCGILRHVQDTHSGRGFLQRVYKSPCCKLTGFIHLNIYVATEWQARGIIGQLTSLKQLRVTECTDKAMALLDGSGTLRNLEQLSRFMFYKCLSLTKLPETMGLLTKLDYLDLYDCEKVQELPNSIEQLKLLTNLHLRKCSSLETLPDSLGALTNLQQLLIVQCTAITKLPTSIGSLTRLQDLTIDRCSELQALPDSLRQLDALVDLEIFDCGSLEGLGISRVLQGLRIWGCSPIIELPGSCLKVVDTNVRDDIGDLWDVSQYHWVRRCLKVVQELEADDCGFFRLVQEDIDDESGRVIQQRVYNKLPC